MFRFLRMKCVVLVLWFISYMIIVDDLVFLKLFFFVDWEF